MSGRGKLTFVAGLAFAGTERFEVLSELGHGAMGVVYEALDRERATRVALKILREQRADAIVRFKKEFRALRGLAHPNLVRFGELFEQDGSWFFTMELVEGVDFQTWIRPRITAAPPSEMEGADTLAPAAMSHSAFDEPRLRDALRQLGCGLAALHATGKVHRDVKPSNVRVARDGRVVLLDFGLIVETDAEASLTDGHLAGTPDYMAPEQAAATEIGPPADWYAVGVMLYEALTGRLPVSGRGMEVMLRKQRETPPAPASISPGAPRDLADLAMCLLRFDPAARPVGLEVLERLGGSGELRQRTITAPPTSQGAEFVGRETELATLRIGFAAAQAGQMVVMAVIGESGLGKSALVRHFVEELAMAPNAPLILQGRCHENESVPYKAVDGVVDAMSRHLGSMHDAEAARFVPLHAPMLTQAFPVLRRVRALAQAPEPRRKVGPEELRSRVFSAFRELLTRLSAIRPVVIVIDDLQWTDADSAALIEDLLRGQDLCVLLLVTARSGAEAALAELGPDVRRIELGPLSAPEARILVERTARRAGCQVDPAAVVESGAGHPLFLVELARSTPTHPGSAQAADLATVLWSRIEHLEPLARDVLTVVCLTGGPIHEATLVRALGTDRDALSRELAYLRVAQLVRSSLRGGGTVEPYHDRVREVLFDRLDEDLRRDWHRRIGLTLEATPDTDPELLVLHWRAAGDLERAAHYAEGAAARAVSLLAFERAATLLSQAIEGTTNEVDARRRLQRNLGDALAAAGRGLEAAQSYEAASAGAPAADELELTRLAAAQYLRSGHIEQGLKTLARVLEQMGLKVAGTRRSALASLLWQRFRLGIRGLRWKPTDATTISPAELQRLDVLFSTATTLGMIDHIRGADFQTRHLQGALRAGEERRVCRALTVEVVFRASEGRGDPPRSKRLLAQCQEIASRSNDPFLKGLLGLAEGAVDFFALRFREAGDRFEHADRIFGNECVAVQWERTTARYMTCESWIWSGQIGRLAVIDTALSEAERQRDLYGRAMFRAEGHTWRLLQQDQLERAEAGLDDALAGWPTDRFYIPHLTAFSGRCLVLLYRGRAADALELTSVIQPAMRGAMLHRIKVLCTSWNLWRGLAGIACRDVAAVKGAARALGRGPQSAVTGLSRYMMAALETLAGREDTAVALLREATTLLTSNGMLLFANAARFRLGERIGTSEGASLKEAALAYFRDQKIQNPQRFIDVAAPL